MCRLSRAPFLDDPHEWRIAQPSSGLDKLAHIGALISFEQFDPFQLQQTLDRPNENQPPTFHCSRDSCAALDAKTLASFTRQVFGSRPSGRCADLNCLALAYWSLLRAREKVLQGGAV